MNFIVTQLKNENLRIKEWIDFHLKNGFDKVIIYLDHPTDNSETVLKEICQSNSNVIYFSTILGIPMQTPYGTIYTSTTSYNSSNDYLGNLSIAYSLAYSYKRGLNYIKENYKITQHDWVAFIDVDEFIVKTGDCDLKDFLIDIDEIDRLYITSYDMKCPIDLEKSVIEQSLYRWSDETRNNSVFKARGKMMSRIHNLFDIHCCHSLDSDFNKNPNKKTKTMSTGGSLIHEDEVNKNVIDVFHKKEYFKLFHYRNDGNLQNYDEYDDSALKSKLN